MGWKEWEVLFVFQYCIAISYSLIGDPFFGKNS